MAPVWPWKKKAMAPHIRQGIWGEKMAVAMLKKKGYRILGTRVKMGRRDELDIVARMEGTLVFVEVKTRRNENFARPLAAVTRAKQKTLSRAAARYLSRLRPRPPAFRFDVVEVVGEEGDNAPVIRHIERAFNIDSHYNLQW